MLNKIARPFFTKLITPIAKLLLSWGVSPNMVTIIGSLGVVAASLILYPMGLLFWGTVVITLFIFSDMIDGNMARLSNSVSPWGNFLDSTLDRLQDAAIFTGITIWFFTGGDDPVIAIASLACLSTGLIVSYVRAKAESLGYRADVGIAERPERMVVSLVFTGFTGLGLPKIVLAIALIFLAVASLVTIIQRIVVVSRQAASDPNKSVNEAG